MKSKLNNKGYMLIEIILASALAFGLAYFIIDLTIKLKNKNADLMITTLMSTDQAIISNKLMEYIKSENDNFDCNQLRVDNKTIFYKENIINKINDYGNIEEGITCSKNDTNVNINIPISVAQLPDEDFSMIINYEFSIKESLGCADIINNYKCKNVRKGSEYFLEYTGNCIFIDDKNDNCRIKFLTDGDLKLNNDFNIDLFLIGGGAGNGGYGGANSVKLNVGLKSNKTYKITIGKGQTSNGTATKFDTYTASGGTSSTGGLKEGVCEFQEVLKDGSCKYVDNGYSGIYAAKGNSGRAGAGTSGTSTWSCTGWDYWANGCYGYEWRCDNNQKPATVNTGSGGGAAASACGGTSGGDGIVILRKSTEKKIIVNNEVIGTYTGAFITNDESNNNWKVKFLTSGMLVLNKEVNIDLFLVGGGAGNGGYGGKSDVKRNVKLSNNKYQLIIGIGGNANGEQTKFGELYAVSGGTSSAGGATGGVCEFYETLSDGTCKNKTLSSYSGLYAAKGNSGRAGAGTSGTSTWTCTGWDYWANDCYGHEWRCDNNQKSAVVNTGSGGGAAASACGGTSGGTGTIIMRNAR